MSLTRLKLSMSSMIRPSSWPKRRVRSTSAAMTSWKRRWLNRPVSSSVTAWRWIVSCRSTFSIEIAAWFVRYSNSSRWRSENGRAGAGDRDHAEHALLGLRRVQRARERVRAGDLGLRRLAGLQRGRLGRLHGRHVGGHVAGARGLRQRAVGALAHHHAPAFGADAVDRRLHDDRRAARRGPGPCRATRRRGGRSPAAARARAAAPPAAPRAGAPSS